ncbi:unnamed protein product [Linum trigynum]|uniref:Uncharacterized protein n=1 Tax=Linum trigynum TaxID=586398 RepID=A0AAV2FSS4_9ROSI
MKNRTCRPTATGRKENEDKNPRKNRARQKKLQVERPDGHPTQGQLSLSRKSPTPTSDRVDTWEPSWEDSISDDGIPIDDDDYDDDDDDEAEKVAQTQVQRYLGAPMTSTSSTTCRGPDGRFRAASSSQQCGNSKKRKKRANKDKSWLLTRESVVMCTGGPMIPDVIPSFAGHVAHVLWTSPEQDRGVLECYNRSATLDMLKKYKWSVKDSQAMVHNINTSSESLSLFMASIGRQSGTGSTNILKLN